MSLARNASLNALRTCIRVTSSCRSRRVLFSSSVYNDPQAAADRPGDEQGSPPGLFKDTSVNAEPLAKLLNRLHAAMDKSTQQGNKPVGSDHAASTLTKRERRKIRRAIRDAQETVDEIRGTLNINNEKLAKQAEDLMHIGQKMLDQEATVSAHSEQQKSTRRPRPTEPKSFFDGRNPRKNGVQRLSDLDLPAFRQFFEHGLKMPTKASSPLPRPDAQPAQPAQSAHPAQAEPANVKKYTRRIEGFLKPLDSEVKLQDLAPPSPQNPIAHLAHGLDRVLFNPGVYWLQDPRSRVFNFTPWLQTIPRVQDFAFDRVQTFTPSSEDSDLHILAKHTHARYTGSTSSLTGMLSQIYLMLSCERPVNLSNLSQAFQKESTSYTLGQKFPVATKLIYKDGVYSTDSMSSTPGLSDRNVLTWMGTMLEKFLTLPKEQFQLLLQSSPAVSGEKEPPRDAFRFAKIGNYVMRSQLDCFDSRLPGTGVFDIKTRAAMPIRLDIMNWEENSGYYIHKLHGRVESFEREYYDLIRSAFLKYSFQARIGNMDGVMVAYHNTARIFGFQYIPLEEMDERLYGNKHAGPLIFARCVELLQVINDEITYHFPEQSVRCLWDAKPEEGGLNIWVQPHDWAGLGERPIIELQVSAENFLDDQLTRGQAVADHLPDQAWSVRYSISTSSDDEATVRERYRAAVNKQKTIFDLPTGVDINEMEELWAQMDFGGEDAPAAPFKPDMFRHPTAMTIRTRELARRGKEHTDKLEQEAKGKPVVVYGDPVAKLQNALQRP